MTAQEIIKRAQTECGEYVTGYKGDVNCDNLKSICEQMWNRCANLGYNFAQWHCEITSIVGNKNYRYFLDEIMDFQQSKMEASKYFVFHGMRYCMK